MSWCQCQHLPEDQAKLLNLSLVAKTVKLATLASSCFFLFLFKVSNAILRERFLLELNKMSSNFRVQIRAMQLPRTVNMQCEAERGQ